MVLCFANEAATRKLLFIEPSRQAEENRLGKTFCSSSCGAAACAARPSGCAAVLWARRGDGGAPHSWSNCCCVLCINRSHFQSENNLVVVANCACPLLSIHSNLRINWWSTDQNYDPLKYARKGLRSLQTTIQLSESPMAEGIERWPCMPRVSGMIPGARNLKELLIWQKWWTRTKFINSSFRWLRGWRRCLWVHAVRLVPTRSQPMGTSINVVPHFFAIFDLHTLVYQTDM